MGLRAKRIFLVEAEAIIAFEMTEILEDLGFEVIGPSLRLESAIPTARHEEIDVAFLEAILGPGQTSEPVAAILRGRKIPYAFLTSHEAGRISFIRKTDLVIPKPVSPRDVLDAMRRLEGQQL